VPENGLDLFHSTWKPHAADELIRHWPIVHGIYQRIQNIVQIVTR